MRSVHRSASHILQGLQSPVDHQCSTLHRAAHAESDRCDLLRSANGGQRGGVPHRPGAAGRSALAVRCGSRLPNSDPRDPGGGLRTDSVPFCQGQQTSASGAHLNRASGPCGKCAPRCPGTAGLRFAEVC